MEGMKSALAECVGHLTRADIKAETGERFRTLQGGLKCVAWVGGCVCVCVCVCVWRRMFSSRFEPLPSTSCHHAETQQFCTVFRHKWPFGFPNGCQESVSDSLLGCPPERTYLRHPIMPPTPT